MLAWLRARFMPTVRGVECEHVWVPLDPIRYEQGEVGGNVPMRVTWVVDEVCSRCGMESRWPT